MKEISMILPSGWTSDSKTFHNCVVIETNTCPTQFVTVDLERRFFEPGCVTPNPNGLLTVHPSGMIGRGWKDRLFNAAVDYLHGAISNE
jgi:hypothetical protein